MKIPGEEHITTSEELMETERLPEKIIFVGGGYISLEFPLEVVKKRAVINIK